MTEIFIGLNDEFDIDRLVVDPASKKSFGKKGNEVTYYESAVYYLNDDDEKCILYFEGAEQEVWGFNAMYPMGTADEDKKPSVNMKGVLVCYPMTAIANKPTENEQSVMDIFDGLYEKTLEALKRECRDGDNLKVPKTTYSSFVTAQAKKKWSYAIKPVYSYPNAKKENKNDPDKEDHSKPQRAYIKLNTFGKGSNLVCKTGIMGPGDKPLGVTSLISEKGRGKITPVFKWKSIYWGGHGDRSWGGSVSLRLAECNYTPGLGGGPSRRMLGRNTAPDADSSFESPTGETNEGFTPVGGDTNSFNSGESSTKTVVEGSPEKPRRRKKSGHRRRKRTSED